MYMNSAPSKYAVSYPPVMEDRRKSRSFMNYKSLRFFRMGVIKSWVQLVIRLYYC